MEEAKEFLQVTLVESQSLSQHLPPFTPNSNFCFYKQFILRGIHVDQVEPGLVVCTFKGPPRFTDRTGKLAGGSIANLVDGLGGVVAHTEGFPMNVSVDMSISFLSTAHVNLGIALLGFVLMHYFWKKRLECFWVLKYDIEAEHLPRLAEGQ